MNSDALKRMLEASQSRRADDARRFAEADEALCMLCHAYGNDKRSLFIACLYAINEVVPEAIDLSDVPDMQVGHVEARHAGYYLRICKSCRGALLGHLAEWRNERIARRGRPKDHDGGDLWDDEDPARNIPVRVNGAVVMMDDREYADFKARATPQPQGEQHTSLSEHLRNGGAQ